jgi:hypothetical protein
MNLNASCLRDNRLKGILGSVKEMTPLPNASSSAIVDSIRVRNGI